MTDANPTTTDGSISEQVARIEEIIDKLESGDVPLEEAQQLHEEGRALLAELEDTFDLDEGSVIDRD